MVDRSWSPLRDRRDPCGRMTGRIVVGVEPDLDAVDDRPALEAMQPDLVQLRARVRFAEEDEGNLIDGAFGLYPRIALGRGHLEHLALCHRLAGDRDPQRPAIRIVDALEVLFENEPSRDEASFIAVPHARMTRSGLLDRGLRIGSKVVEHHPGDVAVLVHDPPRAMVQPAAGDQGILASAPDAARPPKSHMSIGERRWIPPEIPLEPFTIYRSDRSELEWQTSELEQGRRILELDPDALECDEAVALERQHAAVLERSLDRPCLGERRRQPVRGGRWTGAIDLDRPRYALGCQLGGEQTAHDPLGIVPLQRHGELAFASHGPDLTVSSTRRWLLRVPSRRALRRPLSRSPIVRLSS